MAFALPVRTGQASVMLSMKQSNPPDSGLARHNRRYARQLAQIRPVQAAQIRTFCAA
jgi:hypothetical protein